ALYQANSCLLADAVPCNVRITHLYSPGAKISQASLSSNSNQAAYVTIACRCSFGKGTENKQGSIAVHLFQYSTSLYNDILPPAKVIIAQSGVGAIDMEVRKMELQLEMCRLELRENELQQEFDLRKLEIEVAVR
ncbi:hypothetical protein XENOCAPTIV_014970, partial [Xenoophorus captivus]